MSDSDVTKAICRLWDDHRVLQELAQGATTQYYSDRFIKVPNSDFKEDRGDNPFLVLDTVLFSNRIACIEIGQKEAAREISRLEADNASLRSKLEEAEGALLSAAGTLEGLSYIHDSNPSDAMADMPAVEYARHMLYEARQIARDAHSEALATLASLREADHA